MGRTNHLKTGSEFLPGIGTARLKTAARAAKGKERLRLCAFVMRRSGKTVREIAEALVISRSAACNWLMRADDGLDRLADSRRRAQKCWLDEEQIELLKECIRASPRRFGYDRDLWSGIMAAEVAEGLFSVTYSSRSIRLLLQRNGVACGVPRPRHPRAASPEEQDAFIRRARRLERRDAAAGTPTLVGDECHFSRHSPPGRGLHVKGEPFVAPATAASGRGFTLFGAMDGDTCYVKFADRGNEGAFVGFLDSLDRIVGGKRRRMRMWLDSVSYHGSAEVRTFLRSIRHRIRIRQLLKNTPELNPIEMFWKKIKAELRARSFSSIREMREFTEGLLRSGRMVPSGAARCVVLTTREGEPCRRPRALRRRGSRGIWRRSARRARSARAAPGGPCTGPGESSSRPFRRISLC